MIKIDLKEHDLFIESSAMQVVTVPRVESIVVRVGLPRPKVTVVTAIPLGTGTSDHRALSHRDAESQHPITSIDGLQAALADAAQGTYYVHTQDVAATYWRVPHGLGKRPSVSVVDGGGNLVLGGVEHLDDYSLAITFSVPITGTAYCS